MDKQTETDVYKKLAVFLDNLPGGFPPTESGVELRILRRLFSPEEAELTLHLSVLPEEARVIAHRAKLSTGEVARQLEEMFQKGLVSKSMKEGYPDRYSALQFAIGIWEYHVNDLDQDLARDMGKYVPVLLNLETWSKAPQLRTIPVNKSINHKLEVLPYEDVGALIRGHTQFLVAPCICRREKKLQGEGCDKPEDNCLVLGKATQIYRERGVGREIDREEALQILREADESGLVLQPSNSKNIVNICLCCGCCCAVLRTIKNHPRPATLVSSPFVCSVETEACNGCGVCLERCQMDALSLEDEKVILDINRCIGCGLCVSTCPTDALFLTRKPEFAQKPVPRTFRNALIDIWRVRGKFTPASAAKIITKSKVSRLLAPK
jgi:electron transport complex protein RnfB